MIYRIENHLFDILWRQVMLGNVLDVSAGFFVPNDLGLCHSLLAHWCLHISQHNAAGVNAASANMVFTQRPSAHLGSFATGHDLGTNSVVQTSSASFRAAT
ncbi:hypothetical protein LF1_46390 [Rubripirellula obstinata]|uniref:Uncharacterized protein n=1 Tax=Rubripirellula obstinata TaxID=406547 RepID=A0A5B1CLW9_9BACT|nr:hypothetical protein LF1_46390 [Rubripirellula obstinata]